MTTSILGKATTIIVHSAVGAGLCKGAAWLGRKVFNRQTTAHSQYNQVGDLLDRVIPLHIQGKVARAAHKLRKPLSVINQFFTNKTRMNLRFYSVLIAPLVEESIFRVGFQKGIKYALMSTGVSESVSRITAITSSAFIFSIVHTLDLTRIEFQGNWVNGIGFGILKEKTGLSAAILSHAIYNALVKFKP